MEEGRWVEEGNRKLATGWLGKGWDDGWDKSPSRERARREEVRQREGAPQNQDEERLQRFAAMSQSRFNRIMRREKEQARLEEERRKYDEEKRHLEWQLWQQQWQMAATLQPSQWQPSQWQPNQSLGQGHPKPWHSQNNGMAGHPKSSMCSQAGLWFDAACPSNKKSSISCHFFISVRGLPPARPARPVWKQLFQFA
jgi:hypothetical protein